MSQPNLWEFPGGKLEAGETEIQCIIREIQEELELQIIPQQRLTPVQHTFGKKCIELIPYRCTIKSGTIRLKEHQQYAWLTDDDKLASLAWCQADLPILKEYLQLTTTS